MNKKTIVEWKTEFEKLLNDESNEKFFNNPNNLAFSYSRRKAAIPELLEVTRFIDDNNLYMGHKKQPTAPMSLRVYCILNDIHDMESYPKCPMCGKGRSFDSITKGFKMTCGKRTCFQSHPETNKKRQSTAKQNYGDLKSAYYDTSRKTVKERYGTDNISKLEEIKQKKIETSRKKYGTDYPWQTEEVKKDRIKGVIEKYGVTNVSSSAKIKRLKEETCLKNWGYINPFQVPEIKERIKNRWIELYGVGNISQAIETHLKKVEKTGFLYTTPSGEIVKYQGNEHILLDYLYSKYNEYNVYAQPEIRIPYKDRNDVLHFWFPDGMIDTGNKKILIEGRDVDLLKPLFTYSLHLKHKIMGGLSCGYDTNLYIYVNRSIPELYKITYSPDNDDWKFLSIYESVNHKRRILSMLIDCGFEKLKTV